MPLKQPGERHPMPKHEFVQPAVTDLGTLRDMTQQQFNKIGSAVDVHSTPENQLVGSLVPAPPP